MKTISFFGHSTIIDNDELSQRVKQVLAEEMCKGCSEFLIGCHGDFDSIALQCCLDFKKEVDPAVKITAVLTSLSFLKKDEFGYGKAEFYKKKGCQTIMYDIEEVHYKNRINYSNRKMVDNSDIIICFVDMKAYRSGAKRAINYALRRNKKVINLYS